MEPRKIDWVRPDVWVEFCFPMSDVIQMSLWCHNTCISMLKSVNYLFVQVRVPEFSFTEHQSRSWWEKRAIRSLHIYIKITLSIKTIQRTKTPFMHFVLLLLFTITDTKRPNIQRAGHKVVMQSDTTRSLSVSERKVHFPAAHNDLANVVFTLPHRSTLTVQDRKSLWFQGPDFVGFKRTARLIAAESYQFRFISNLDDCFGAVTDERQQKLNEWCKYGYSRRGLENWVSEKHRSNRDQAKRRVIEELLSFQRVMRISGEVDQDELARQYRVLTKNARSFAFMLGRADYAASRADVGSELLTRHQSYMRAHLPKCQSPQNCLPIHNNTAQPKHQEAVDCPIPRVSDLASRN